MFLCTDNKQEQDILSLKEGRFRIDFISIKLSLESNEVTGCGYIYQDNNKRLKLVFFRNSIVQNNKESLSDFFKPDITGGLSESNCKVIANDIGGNEYHATINLNIKSFQEIIEVRVVKLTTNKTYTLNRAIFSGKYDIPSNRNHIHISSFLPYKQSFLLVNNDKPKQWDYSFEHHSRKEINSWRIIISDDCEINISQYNTYLEILFATENITEILYKRVVRSLSFVLGKELEPMYFSICSLGTCFYSANPIYSINSNMPPPLLTNHGDDESFNTLFLKYYNYLESTSDKIFLKILKNNKRLIESSRLYLFNFGQLLSIQIEHIAATFFKNHRLVLLDEKDFKNDIQNLIDYVNEEFELKHNGSKQWIINELEKGTKSEKRTNQKIVKQLIDDKIAVGNFNSWKDLRNAIAHGGIKKADNKKLLSMIYDCIEIYYTMIFNIIKYEGFYSLSSVDDYASKKEYSLPNENKQ